MDKPNEVATLISSMEKAFGRGILMAASGDAPHPDVEVISTGSFALDRALGVGGLPKGRIVEIFGPEASGKTTLALSVLAQAQKQGAVAAFVDAEHALDLRYARDLGVDCSRMLLSQPDCGEQAMDVVEALVRSGQIGVVVIDSVAALVPKAEIDGEVGSAATGIDGGHVGLQARLMSRAMRKLASLAHQTGTMLIFLDRVPPFPLADRPTFHNTVSTGGSALRFYASVRIDIRRIGSIVVDGIPVGNRVKIKVVKNKMAPPYRQVEVDMLFGTAGAIGPSPLAGPGFCRQAEVFDVAYGLGVIKRSGAFYKLGDYTVGQGRLRAIAELCTDSDLCGRIEALIGDAPCPSFEDSEVEPSATEQ